MELYILSILLVLVCSSSAQSNCVNIKCAPEDKSIFDESQVGISCLNGTTLYYCNTHEKEYCYMNTMTPLNGECRSNATRFEYFPVQIALPGERCDPQRSLYEWGYGYRSCSAYRCLGFLENERCGVDQDCNPGLYCDSSLKTCQQIKALGNFEIFSWILWEWFFYRCPMPRICWMWTYSSLHIFESNWCKWKMYTVSNYFKWHFYIC